MRAWPRGGPSVDQDDDEGRLIVTSAKGRPVADGKPTALHVAAARLVIAADRKLGDKTPDWIERIAQGLPGRR